MSSIPAITVYSENFSKLYQRWVATLPSGFHPVVKVIEIAKDGYGFCSGSWYDAIIQKIQHFLDTLKGLPEGTLCLCCDVDIFFAKRTDALANYLRDEMETRGLDMLFMQENQMESVNGGFYCVRNVERVRQALSHAMEYCMKKTQYADQDYYNSEEFKNSGVKWGVIDTSLVAWGGTVFNREKTLFHHAVCCVTMEDKLKQQNQIARLLKVSLS